MLFEDIFYPGNKEKRIAIEAKRVVIEDQITGFQNAWNDLADMMNEAIGNSKDDEVKKIEFRRLEKTWEKYPLDECVTEIKEVLDETQEIFDVLIAMLGIDKYIEEWGEDFDITSTSVKDLEIIGGILDAMLGGTASIIVAGYIFTGLAFTQVVSLAVGGAFSTATVVLGSVCGGLLAGGIVFAAVDAIVSAITGAIERKTLREALDCYELIHDKVSAPLYDAIPSIRNVEVIVKKKLMLELGHGYFLKYDKNKEQYVVIFIEEFADEVMCCNSMLSSVSENTAVENPYDLELDELREKYPAMKSFAFCKA